MGRPLPLKTLAFAGGMAVLTALLASVAMVPALAFFFLLLLLPAPLLTAWVYLASGKGWAYGSAALAVLLAFLVGGGPIAGIAFVCVMGGLALGSAVAQRARPLLAGAMITVAMLAGVLLLLVLLKAMGTDVLAPLRQAAGDMGGAWTGSLLLPANQAQQKLADRILYLFPASLALFFSGCALAIYALARWTLGRRYDVAPMPPFAEWRMPRWVPWVFVPALLLWLFGLLPGGRGTARLGDNLLQVMSMFFEVQGMAVALWWLRRGMGRVLAAILVVLGAVIPYTAIFLMFLGLWDALMDFRKLEPRRER